jgi:hypothetical protein
MLLHHRAVLQLTAEQVTRLEAMQQQMKAQKQERRGTPRPAPATTASLPTHSAPM